MTSAGRSFPCIRSLQPVSARAVTANVDHQGKHPRTRNGLADSTTFVEQIGVWADLWPDANVGVVTGADSGLVVLDEDGPEGSAALAQLGEIPITVEARTARGRHFYFRHPGHLIRNSTGSIGTMLDVRADGGYVVAPPSRHASGKPYEWIRDPLTTELAPWPDFLRRKLAANSANVGRIVGRLSRATTVNSPNDLLVRRIGAYFARVGPQAVGTRNATAFSIAAWLTHDMAVAPVIARAHLERWNATNKPPLDKAEIADVLSSAIRNGHRPVGAGFARDPGTWEIHLRRALGGRP